MREDNAEENFEGQFVSGVISMWRAREEWFIEKGIPSRP
jgi:hypothetical protein